MLKDAFDKMLWSLLVVTLVALAVVLSGLGSGERAGEKTASLDKALEREMAYQARVNFLQKLYDPVESLRRSGELQAALFKLDELARSYPNEAHGRILKGEILYGMGALDEAVVCREGSGSTATMWTEKAPSRGGPRSRKWRMKVYG
jgi:hypothetical protein